MRSLSDEREPDLFLLLGLFADLFSLRNYSATESRRLTVLLLNVCAGIGVPEAGILNADAEFTPISFIAVLRAVSLSLMVTQ